MVMVVLKMSLSCGSTYAARIIVFPTPWTTSPSRIGQEIADSIFNAMWKYVHISNKMNICLLFKSISRS